MAIGGEDGSVRLLDLTTGSCGPPPAGIAAPVNDALFTPDGRTLVTVGEDGDVDPLGRPPGGGGGDAVRPHASAFSPQLADNGKTLYTASLDGTVLIWDLAGSRRLGRRFTAGADDSPATR